MRKKCKKLLCCAFATIIPIASMIGCGKVAGSSSDISFWVYGDQEELVMYNAMIEEFNSTYGKSHDITVHISQKPVSGYSQQIQLYSTSNSGPDVFFVYDDNIKNWINQGLMADITAEIAAVTDIDISDIPEATMSRLHYDIEHNTSNPDDPIYGMPLDTKPSAFYYNESFFKAMGIIIISVDEEDLDKWNNNEIPDNNGNYKRDFSKLNGVTVPAKGYYRSETPYYNGSPDGWQKPLSDEILVFNNRIAMNWDETEDLAMLFTPSYNPAVSNMIVEGEKFTGCEYGFFTEWWFNYGWSVGGDCLTDLTGDGEWNFSLLEYTPNYIVADGKTYVGEYSGKTYQAGETLSLQDKLELPKGKYLVPDSVGGYCVKDSQNATLTAQDVAVSTRATVKAASDEGTLKELPSTREAFTRYLKLGAEKSADIEGEGGFDISPNPNVFSTRQRSNYFYSGNMAMLCEYSSYMSTIAKQFKDRGWTFDLAPVCVYKQYEDPSDPDCDTVVAKGKEAGQSTTKSLGIRRKSTKKGKAAEFICWMASKDGQRIAAQHGGFPNQSELVSEIKFNEGVAPNNIKAFSDAMAFQRAGDWWYMKDYEWILVWSTPLNSNVRNGQQTYSDWKTTAINNTNERLKSY